MRSVYMAATGCTGLISVNGGGDYNGPCQHVLIECHECTLNVGDACEVDIGYTDNHSVLVHGYAKEINPISPDGIYRVRVYDDLILASDFLIASDDPENPLTYNNISAGQLVTNVLNLASLTNLSIGEPGFTFGVNNPVKVQLIKSWDFVRQICEMIVWHCWADNSGVVHFANLPPYPTGGASHALTTGNSGDLNVVNHTRSDEKLRNKLVVYGYNGVCAVASAPPPAGVSLPDGFFKTAVVSYPEIIDDQAMADAIANYNLNLLNRVTETITVDAIGDPDVIRGSTVSISETETDSSGTWFVYEATHRITASEGYRMHLTLSK